LFQRQILQEGENIIAMPPPGLFGRLIQNKRRLLWEKKEGVDATLIVADVKFGVHSMILGAESPLLQSRFQASLRKSGLREITIEEADIHTVWRTLMLIYLGYYSTSPCPKAATSGTFISSSSWCCTKMNSRHIER
jgi:nitroreductase